VNDQTNKKTPDIESEQPLENNTTMEKTDSIVATKIISALTNYPRQSISGLIDFSKNSISEYDSVFNHLTELDEWMIDYIFDEQLKEYYTCSTCVSYFYSIEEKSNGTHNLYILSTDKMTYRYLDCFNLKTNSTYIYTPSFKEGQPEYLARRYGEFISDSVYSCTNINKQFDFNPQRTITYCDSTTVVFSLNNNGIEDTISINMLAWPLACIWSIEPLSLKNE
jgi:hypothetical protein